MTNKEAISVLESINAKTDYFLINDDARAEAIDMAISALQAQDSKTGRCATCKHDPPSKKWPCEDCDMREPADRWETRNVPDTNVGDMVSRQAAIDTLDVGAELFRRVLDEPDVVGIERKKYEWGLNLIESYIADMKELPPAQTEQRSAYEDGYEKGYNDGFEVGQHDIQPERKTGKWIDKGWNGDWQYQMDGRGRSWHEWQCSECNHITKGAKWHFCPNCGADMRGEQNEAD